MTAVAELDAVSKRYGAAMAVETVSLALQPGEVVALVGHNGAGKTTLIKLVLGLIRPSAGRVRVMGVDPAAAGGAAARRALGFLPESVAFHDAMTGVELMNFYARLKGAPPSRNSDLLDRVGLGEAARRRVATYSKGMRQRLGLAQALIGAPRLLLFDEPTSGLDPASRADVYTTIDALRDEGSTILVSTHALQEIEGRAGRVAVMHSGRLVACGSLAEIRRGAGLEATLTVRVRPCRSAELLRRLPDGVRGAALDERTLRLAVDPSAKMTLLRHLLAMTDMVEDVEIAMPGLEDLYRRLAQQPNGGMA